MFNYRAAFL